MSSAQNWGSLKKADGQRCHCAQWYSYEVPGLSISVGAFPVVVISVKKRTEYQTMSMVSDPANPAQLSLCLGSKWVVSEP